MKRTRCTACRRDVGRHDEDCIYNLQARGALTAASMSVAEEPVAVRAAMIHAIAARLDRELGSEWPDELAAVQQAILNNSVDAVLEVFTVIPITSSDSERSEK